MIALHQRLLYRAAIDNVAVLADCLKAYLLVVNFDHHEMIVFIKRESSEIAPEIYVSASGHPTRTGNKVLNALLWLRPFVDVIVS